MSRNNHPGDSHDVKQRLHILAKRRYKINFPRLEHFFKLYGRSMNLVNVDMRMQGHVRSQKDGYHFRDSNAKVDIAAVAQRN